MSVQRHSTQGQLLSSLTLDYFACGNIFMCEEKVEKYVSTKRSGILMEPLKGRFRMFSYVVRCMNCSFMGCLSIYSSLSLFL